MTLGIKKNKCFDAVCGCSRLQERDLDYKSVPLLCIVGMPVVTLSQFQLHCAHSGVARRSRQALPDTERGEGGWNKVFQDLHLTHNIPVWGTAHIKRATHTNVGMGGE